MDKEEVLNNLYFNYCENKMSHICLVETNNLDLCLNDIKILIKRIFCQNKYNDECTKCNICTLVDNDSLSSLMIIKPDGKIINKDMIDSLKNNFSTKSIFTDQKIYIIVSPEKMNSTAYNKMLKFTEEPENNIIGFLITDNKDNVPATIISRCECHKMIYNKTNNTIDDEELYGLAKDFVNSIEDNKDVINFINSNQLLVSAERDTIVSLVKIMYTIYRNLLNEHSNKSNQYLEKLNILKKYLEQLNYNINLDLMLESLAIEIGGLNEKKSLWSCF